jgi:orotidine-5'-phosphate decarboxylase
VRTTPAEAAACGFGARLAAAVATRGPLCAGIDPHPDLLRDWGLGDDVAGLERFSQQALAALVPEVALIKPQAAFYERHGARGIAVLERVLATCRQAGALVLLDVKRGDIGSTMAGYAAAYLRDGAPLAADAITVSPYPGMGALEGTFELARRTGRGVFVVALTSNPEAAAIQGALTRSGTSVAQSVVDEVAARNAGRHPGDLGVVVGVSARARALRLSRMNGPILAPGIGAQGARLTELPSIFGAATRQVVPAISRDLLRHGPGVAPLRQAARRMTEQVTTVCRIESEPVAEGPPG